jgi:hypothetical protein
MLRYVVWQKFTEVLEVFTALHRPDDGGSKHL